MFKVGQKVVYIMRTLPELGLIEGEIYTIQGIEYCACSQNLDIGLTHDLFMTICGVSCGQIINLDDRYFLSSEGFRPLVDATVIEDVTYEETKTRLDKILGNG